MRVALVGKQRWDIATIDYENTLRRVLRVIRYQNLLGSVIGHADPADIETTWMERHEEYSFDVASVAVSNFEEAARGEVVADEELSKELDGLRERSAQLVPVMLRDTVEQGDLVSHRRPEVHLGAILSFACWSLVAPAAWGPLLQHAATARSRG